MHVAWAPTAGRIPLSSAVCPVVFVARPRVDLASHGHGPHGHVPQSLSILSFFDATPRDAVLARSLAGLSLLLESPAGAWWKNWVRGFVDLDLLRTCTHCIQVASPMPPTPQRGPRVMYCLLGRFCFQRFPAAFGELEWVTEIIFFHIFDKLKKLYKKPDFIDADPGIC